jgi:hypothetical protein
MGKLGVDSIGKVCWFIQIWLLTQSHITYILGVLVSPREELIRGALKYAWKDGRSQIKGTPSQKSPETLQNVRFYSSCSQIS